MFIKLQSRIYQLPGEKITFRAYAAIVLVMVLLITTSSVMAVPEPGLTAVGPTSNSTGFPSWYKDSNGVRLELCLDAVTALCAFLPGDVPDPNSPLAMPNNFPEEAFWTLGSSTMTTDATDGKAILVFALEAAFSGGPAVPGDQVSFGRIRIWVDNLVPSSEYRVTHPYGVDTFISDPVFDRRMIRFTQDIGIGALGDFSGALNGRVGPFLIWDPGVEPAAPAGYIGDPDVLHPVTGSPFITNLFRVEGPVGSFPGSPDQCSDPGLGDDPVATDDCIESNLFSLVGKYATNADVNGDRATYTQSNAVGGHIDVFASTEPGMDIQVNGYGNPVLTPGGNGYYFGQVNFVGGVPAQVEIINTSDTPDTAKTIPVVDQVSIRKAVFNTETGTLSIEAVSSDTYNDPVLTAAGFGALDGNGKLDVTGQAIPPQFITVSSARGGSASVPVEVISAPAVCHALVLGHTGGGTDPVADPANSTGCGLGMYYQGELITLINATADPGSRISGWTGTDQDASTAGSNAFTMPNADHAVSVGYEDVPPSVTSITLLNPAVTNRSIVYFSVAFSESVTGVDASDLTLNSTGTIADEAVISVTGTGSTRNVGVFTGTGDGDIFLDVSDDDSITDAAGSQLGGAGGGNGSYDAGPSYTIDRTPPTVVSILRLNPENTTRTVVYFQATFSEAVTGTNTSDFALTVTNTISGATISSITGTGSTRNVGVNTGTGSGTINLNVVDDDTIRDAAGNRLGGTGTGNGNFNTGQSYNVR